MKATFNYTYKACNPEGELVFQYSPIKNIKSSDLEKIGLLDFDISNFGYDLEHPISVSALPSYDESINLLLTGYNNTPRIINTRIIPKLYNLYLISDSESHIYDDTLLLHLTEFYLLYNTISLLLLLGVFTGGNLKIGNYYFYFKYEDVDGNQTDFFDESGLVSIFIGSLIKSIVSGLLDENSKKLIKFKLTNLDTAFNKISIYYSRSTSDIHLSQTTRYYKLTNPISFKNSSEVIIISGFEDVTEVTEADFNLLYLVYDSFLTSAICLNRLFVAGCKKQEANFEELKNISLYITPHLSTKSYTNSLSSTLTANSYYDPIYIYENVGYWPDEYYRFGVVYIYKNNTLSPVFNIRGHSQLTKRTQYNVEIANDFNNQTIQVNNDYSLNNLLENSKGVIKIADYTIKQNEVIGIRMEIPKLIVEYLLQTYNIVGMFFVRLKRMPTTLCLALTTGVEAISNTPLQLSNKSDRTVLLYLSFLNYNQLILSNPVNHILLTGYHYGAYCPEYDVNSEYLNTFFTGAEMQIRPIVRIVPSSDIKSTLYSDCSIQNKSTYFTMPAYHDVKIIGVEDNVKLVGIETSDTIKHQTLFSARAGEAEDSSFEWAESDEINASKNAWTKLIRGSFGPYLGIVGYSGIGDYVDIKIPDFDEKNHKSYMLLRYFDNTLYYSISPRLSLINLSEKSSSIVDITCYRGDCYICNFTHRIIRNFADPTAPTNEVIVDSNTWKDNWKIDADAKIVVQNYEEGGKKPKGLLYVNVGDLNAVKLGLWIQMQVRSSINLNIRTIDSSNVSEHTLFGTARTFYPYTPMSTAGIYKIPEALGYNKGLEKNTSDKYNFTLAEAPTYTSEYSTRICYSDISILKFFKNSFRTFLLGNYRDYSKTYGGIIKLVELNDNLVCIFEHGIALISINERTLAGQGTNGNVYINTNKVLPETMTIISDTYGSLWADSIIKTDKAIYGIDTVAKKIWRTNGSLFECISDLKVQEFLNNNITLELNELTPILGIRNVKTHYNKFKLDVIFTFYDDLNQIDERVWNLCYNELLNKWVTFYSWVPSFSENISNVFFSFDRSVSHVISKLGLNSISDSAYRKLALKESIIKIENFKTDFVISYSKYEGKAIILNAKLLYDENKFFTTFKIIDNLLYLVNPEQLKTILKSDEFNNGPKVIKLNVQLDYTFELTSGAKLSPTTMKSSVYLMFEDDFEECLTSFWKHGLSGLMKTVGDIKPTFWYGKQHPFEFEFVVAEKPDAHKIFDNLQIISNKAEPESFHYEIVGEVYDFAKDKKNMYIRQEATKEFYQYNGSNISYNENYLTLEDKHRPLYKGSSEYDKSVIFPLYYKRVDTLNDVEDAYHYFTDDHADYSNLAGAEIKYYPLLDEFRIVNHVKGWDMNKYGRLKGNMVYKEDKWDVQINPINYIEYNEPKWEDLNGNLTNKVPIEVNQNPIPSDLVELVETNNEWNVPDSFKNGGSYEGGRGSILWPNTCKNKEAKVKDRYIKIKIRYSGELLAVIQAIYTMYSTSFS